jgi:hypothetical protein
MSDRDWHASATLSERASEQAHDGLKCRPVRVNHLGDGSNHSNVECLGGVSYHSEGLGDIPVFPTIEALLYKEGPRLIGEDRASDELSRLCLGGTKSNDCVSG